MFSQDNIVVIKEYLDKKFVKLDGRVKSSQIFEELKSKLESYWTEADFKKALSFGINNNQFPGYDLSRGRFGGLGRKKTASFIMEESHGTQEGSISSDSKNEVPPMVTSVKESVILFPVLSRIFRKS